MHSEPVPARRFSSAFAERFGRTTHFHPEEPRKIIGVGETAGTGDLPHGQFGKLYEYWINAILSAPTTHSANIIGNTTNALYELGPKRFAEAAVNALAKRRDAATFGEFREMWNALDFRSAWKKAKTAFDLETLTPGGKFRENATVAIPGNKNAAWRE